ncbi:MAG TPA: hypothetical protein DFR83_08925 [Deltaproteobacteria bacterium]|nr:hypothetical protein [Deltaproteobacteria bacterium]
MPSFLLVLLSSLASAQDCDAAQLAKETAEATPVGSARAFVQLANCDANAAKAIAAETLPRLLGGDDANQAAVMAIRVGAAEPVAAWMDGLEADERARTVRALGEACSDSPEVQVFFVDRATTLGEKFWSDRWYRALTTCRVPAVQGILSAELDKGLGDDRLRFFAVLETYARSAGGGAVARLETLAQSTDDAEAQANIIAAFADAARVGTPEGIDAAAAQVATETIRKVAPTLKVKAVEQARMTLMALGDEPGSDAMAAIRYKAFDRGGETFIWGAVANETATCKNGKVQQRIHVAQVKERGNTWPDQLEDKVSGSAEITWELTLAERCKGTGEVKWLLSSAPFSDDEAYKAWADKTVEEASDAAAKSAVIEQEPLQI